MINGEFALAGLLLDHAADEFSNHGCNDMEIENTPENLQVVRRMIAASDYPEDEPKIVNDGRHICIYDWMMMRYLSEKLKKISDEISGVSSDGLGWG